MKLLRTLRLDASDEQVFERSAAPGEWAVTGGFAFMQATPETLSAKRLQAFRNGFLGLGSFGWATLVEVAELDADEYAQAERTLAAHLVDEYGAPNVETALPAASEELAYAASLCDAEPHTVLALTREFDADGGIVESLRVVRRGSGAEHAGLRLFGPE